MRKETCDIRKFRVLCCRRREFWTSEKKLRESSFIGTVAVSIFYVIVDREGYTKYTLKLKQN
jgi:hypothetical protein